jgi:hypothetical protein
MLPELSPDEPLPIITEPLSPLSDEPDTMLTSPLEPKALVESDEPTNTSPDEDTSLLPLINTTLPPAPLMPAPPLTLTSPPSRRIELPSEVPLSPVLIFTTPDLISLGPEEINTSPLSKPLPELPDDIETLPPVF